MPQRIVDAAQAFDALRQEITPQALRELTALANASGNANEINLGVAVAKIVYANDRAALIAAAMITSSGVSRPMVDIGSEDREDDAPLNEKGGPLDG